MNTERFNRNLLLAILVSYIVALYVFPIVSAYAVTSFSFWYSLANQPLSLLRLGAALLVPAVFLTLLKPRAAAALAACGLMAFPVLHWADFYVTGSILRRNYCHMAGYFVFALLANSYYRHPLHKRFAGVYLTGMLLCVSNEMVQDQSMLLFAKQACFCMADISKSGWGMTLGCLFYYLTRREERTDRKAGIFRRSLGEYLSEPLGMLLVLLIGNAYLVACSSLLTTPIYAPLAVFGTLAGTWLTVQTLRLCSGKLARKLVVALFSLAIVIQAAALLKYGRRGVTFNRYGLTIYNGRPIPLFDAVIFPDGGFRLVDKKHHRFNKTDVEVLLKHKPDVIIFGSGVSDWDGKNLPPIDRHPETGLPRVIIQRTPLACRTFNTLKRESSARILFVLHNTC